MKVDANAAEHEIMEAAAGVLREHDARSDAETIERVVGEYLAGNLGAAGGKAVREALERGQVSELYLTAVDPGEAETMADELVAKARQTSARVRFIEDPALLAEHDGVAAALRYRA
jgi:peptide subunit release factor 1 (eRF1)